MTTSCAKIEREDRVVWLLTQLICLTVNINRAEDAQPMRPEDFWPFGLPASIYGSGDEEGGERHDRRERRPVRQLHAANVWRRG